VTRPQARRTAQSSIFGARNAAEVARDEARLVAAGTTTPNPQVGGCCGGFADRAVLQRLACEHGRD
jgi:hypothetical protein